MERGVYSPFPPAEKQGHSSFPAKPRKIKSPEQKEKFLQDKFILDDALLIGRDYLEATGNLPTRANFEALYANDFFDHRAEEIERIFTSWEIFQTDIEIEYGFEMERRERRKREILEIIELDQQVGALHPLLFKDTIASKSYDEVIKLGANDEDGPNGRSKWNLRIFMESDVDDDEKIRRYVKFKIAEALTDNLDNKDGDKPKKSQVDPFIRRTTIALGFNVETGIVVSSLKIEIMKSNTALTQEQVAYHIEEVAEENGWTDYLDPQTRENDLSALKNAAEWSEPPYPLPERSFYNLLRSRVLGKSAIDGYLASEAKPEHIKPIGEILVEHKEYMDQFKHRTRHETNSYTKEQCIKYGQWLTSLVDPYGLSLSKSIIKLAGRLELGPGRSAIESHFGNLTNYYLEVGLGYNNRNPSGAFEHWTQQDWIAYVQSVASKNDGYVSIPILTEEARHAKKEGRLVPSLRVLVDNVGKLSDLVKAAGIKSKPNHVFDEEKYFRNAIEFYHQNGRLPKKRDLMNSPLLPAPATAFKNWGGLGNFNQKLLEKISEIEDSTHNATTEVYESELAA